MHRNTLLLVKAVYFFTSSNISEVISGFLPCRFPLLPLHYHPQAPPVASHMIWLDGSLVQCHAVSAGRPATRAAVTTNLLPAFRLFIYICISNCYSYTDTKAMTEHYRVVYKCCYECLGFYWDGVSINTSMAHCTLLTCRAMVEFSLSHECLPTRPCSLRLLNFLK